MRRFGDKVAHEGEGQAAPTDVECVNDLDQAFG